LYPRVGFLVSPSAPVASVIDALRSVSIAANPLPLHVVESKLDFKPNIVMDKVQMIYPSKTSCFPIGENPSQWEINKQSKDGHYVWIYWHQRQCCI
jgi:TraU protein